MCMKYFLFNIIILLLGIWLVLKSSLRQKFYRAYILRKIAQNYFYLNDKGIFSSYIILKIADLIYAENIKNQKILLSYINAHDFKSVTDFFMKKDKVAAYAFGAFFNLKENKKNLQQYIKQNSKDKLGLLILGLIYDSEFQKNKLKQIVNTLQNFKFKKAQNGIKYYLKAKSELYDADMFEASAHTLKAIKIFKKHNCFYEEAESYALLGEIYRISAVYDLSQTMFDTALKMYDCLDNEIKSAQIKALKAMLFVGQERFGEADNLFSQSKKTLKRAKLTQFEAEIINQQALLNILQKKYSKALKYTTNALMLHQKCKNISGKAFSFELMAMIYFYKKDYQASLVNAQNAMKNYLKTKNYSGFADSAFIAAQSLFELKEYEKAENMCRELIDTYEKHSTCFHIASAYSLLGLIYIKLKDFNRAAALFKKSVNLEQCNERYTAAATDYTNLALIEKKLGHKENELRYLDAALENAKKQGDDKLIKIIGQQIKKQTVLDNK